MSESTKGNLLIGSGVIAKGSLTAPGLIEVDGTVEGVINAHAVNVTDQGIVSGTSTATHIRVAGKLLETSTAHQSLLIESTGLVSGKIHYGDLEIRKGGQLQGDIQSAPTKASL